MTSRTAHSSLWILCVVLMLTGSVTAAQDSPGPEPGGGWLGVLLGNGKSESADGADVEGVPVRRVLKDGPAMKAGLRAGDIILEVDGTGVKSPNGLIGTVSGLDSGSWIAMKIDRRGKSREIRVRLEERPENTSNLRYREGYVGVQAIDLPETLQSHFGAPEKSGVMISQVDDGSPGYVSGLEPGDVVFEVQGEPVRSARQLQELLSGGGVGNTLEILAMRSGVAIVVESVVIDVPEEILEQRNQRVERRLKQNRSDR